MSVLHRTKLFIITSALSLTITSQAQGIRRLFEDGSFSGRVQADVQYCLKDSANDRSDYVNQFLSSVYIDGNYTSKMIDAGLRFEMFENPLPSLGREYKGAGVPHIHLKLNLGKVTFTGGDFYEQFGNGLVLRTYEERTLGLDNALRGGRITYTPVSWFHLKAIAGVQRNCWEWSKSWIKGGDTEIELSQWLPGLKDKNGSWLIGGSLVSKHEQPELILAAPMKQLNLPENIASFAARMKYQARNIRIEGEYAHKINDPSADNGYIYHPGQALFLSASYYKTGFGISLSAKHTDNMSFRSERSATGNGLMINYLPAFTRQHTYLLASLYPYATQANGEVAFRGDLFYKFKKNTPMGGKYGMDLRFNYSQIYELQKQYEGEAQKALPGTYGYHTSLFRIGRQTYYRDINIELSRRMNRDLKLTLMYMNLRYNRIVVGKPGMINANAGIAEVLYRVSKKFTVRGEMQYLSTRQDQGDWCAAVLELSFSPHWIFSLSDQYNHGGEAHDNYLLGAIAYATGAHRIQLSGGQQREGYNCAGGICRYVPSTKGFSLSYTTNF